MKNNILKIAAMNALATAAYIVAVASFMFYAPKIFQSGDDKTVLIPILMLMLFVLSAAMTSSLLFGRPVFWYLDGKKKEALTLLFSTLVIFLLITLVAFFALFLRLASR